MRLSLEVKAEVIDYVYTANKPQSAGLERISNMRLILEYVGYSFLLFFTVFILFIGIYNLDLAVNGPRTLNQAPVIKDRCR